MSFSNNQNFESPSGGQADWDSSLNSNFAIAERGYHAKLTAGHDIDSGHILWIASGSIVHHYDPNSLDLKRPAAISYKAVSSGESDFFLINGIVTSLDVISGSIIPGEAVFVSAATPGFPVGSYSTAAYPAGFALSDTGLVFRPGKNEHLEEITVVSSLGELVVGSTHLFGIDVGHRGMFTQLKVVTSHDLYEVKLFSGSASVSSELLYETQSGGAVDLIYIDALPFPYKNTDVTSPGMLFGVLIPSSDSTIGSSHMNVTLIAERVR
jgi:hypothetical protein